MKPKYLLIIIFFLLKSNAFADIAPNPIIVKGIVPARPVNIQMVSEVVTADVSKDSSFVTCVFNMRNFGAAQDIDVGFPIMNFYLWGVPVQKEPGKQSFLGSFTNDYLNPINKNQFEVLVNGVPIQKININIPKNLEAILEGAGNDRYKLLQDYENQSKPWYLWKVHFAKHQSLQIIVKYRLPSGGYRLYNFFNYILSTGAGWKGKIENAKVIVNLKNIPKDQIISISPRNYTQSPTQVAWEFKNLEPTIKNDILIEYERVKGEYANADIFKIAYFVNGKRVKYTEFRDQPLNDIAKIDVVSKSALYNEGAMFVYTNQYALDVFLKKIKVLNPVVWNKLSGGSAEKFVKYYTFEINSEKISSADIFEKLYKINTSKKIEKINIVNRRIVLTLAQ